MRSIMCGWWVGRVGGWGARVREIREGVNYWALYKKAILV